VVPVHQELPTNPPCLLSKARTLPVQGPASKMVIVLTCLLPPLTRLHAQQQQVQAAKPLLARKKPDSSCRGTLLHAHQVPRCLQRAGEQELRNRVVFTFASHWCLNSMAFSHNAD